MQFPNQLNPGSQEFLELREQLAAQIPIEAMLSLAEQTHQTAQELLAHSLFTEQWRWHKDWIRERIDWKSNSIPAKEIIIQAQNEVALSDAGALCSHVIRTTLRPLFTNHGSRNPMALIPRSEGIALTTPFSKSAHLTPASAGTHWLKRARTSTYPEEKREKFFHHFLLSLGLLISHPFCDGNGRLSRVMLNTAAYTPSKKAFPWSVFFLLRNGKYLYNVLPNFRGPQLNLCIFSAAGEAVKDAESKLNRLSDIQAKAAILPNHPTRPGQQARWKKPFLFS